MSHLWTHREAEQATNGVSSAPWSASGIAIDSRLLAAGDLFIALETQRRDGHEFVGHAFAAGAAAACVHQQIDASDGPLLRVENSYDALLSLARRARARSKARLCAITGSAGKTTAKNMLAHCLQGQGDYYAAPRSYNNQWGVPVSLASLPPHCDTGIFELGMNAKGEIAALSGLVRPHLALVLNVSEAHLGGFTSREAIAHAKAEIFSGLADNGIALINRDDTHYTLLHEAAVKKSSVIFSFGEHEGADAQLLAFTAHAEGAEIKAKLGAGSKAVEVAWQLRRRDKASALTSLAVLATAQILGMDVEKSAAHLSTFTPDAGRGKEIMLASGVRVIDESYNANPASIRAALENLAACESGRRIAVLGDMAELGSEAEALHLALKEPLSRANIDALYVCGKNMAKLFAGWSKEKTGAHAADAEALLPHLKQDLRAEDVVLLKGSRSMQMERILHALQQEGAS